MEKTRLAKALVEEHKKRLRVAKARKEKLQNYLLNLNEAYSKGKISSAEYLEISHKKHDGRNIQELIHHYDHFINHSEKHIRKHTHKKFSFNFFIFILVLSLLALTIFYLEPGLTGFFAQSNVQSQEFSQALNLNFNESTSYGLRLETIGNLGYLKLSGSIKGQGTVKIYLDDLLILDSSKIKQTDYITGAAVLDSEGINEALQNISNESSPFQGESPSSENTTNASQDQIEKENESPVNVITEKEIIKIFSNICEETCDLSALNLNKTSYTLRIEIDNAKLFLESAKYQTLKEIIQEEPKTNITPETNITSEKNNTIAEERITTTQSRAILGQPVKWTKRFIAEEKNPNVKIPREAEKIETTNSQGEKTKFNVDDLAQDKEVTIQDNPGDYEISYETPAPSVVEEQISRGKKVKISSPDNVHYTDVLAFANLSESLNIKNPSTIKIFWEEQNVYVSPENVQDKDGNGIYDYIEWIVPHLSNQTFDIIVITKAEHLDKDKTFISNIYDQVKTLDNVWSEEISNQDYVRVTFEKNLTSENDITLFPRVISGNPRIEVYELNQTTKIAEFSSLNSNQDNKIFLTSLQNSQDTFDLKVVGGSIEFDYIVDPITSIFSDDFESALAKWDGNGATTWDISTAQKHAGAQSVLASNGNEGDLITDDIDTSDATFINVSFWFMDDDLDATDIDFYFFDGSAYDAITESLESGTEDTWQWVSFTTSDSQYFKSNFRVRFNAVLGTGENLWVDDFVVNKTTPDPDIAAPSYSNPSTNNSNPLPGSTVSHNTNWTDDTQLSYAILEINSTGASCDTLTNVTVNSTFAGITNWSNMSWAVPNACEGKTIGWKQYTNDSSNNLNVTTLQTYTVQNLAPTVTLPVYTNATQKQNTGNLIFNLSVSDVGVGASYCSINVNGNANQTIAVSSGWCNGTYSLAGLSDGNKTINAYANDTLGNIALNNSYVVWIDDTAPTVALPVYTNLTGKRSADTLFINASVSDSGVGASYCAINVATATASNVTIAVSNGWCNASYSLAGTSEGNQIINVYSNDTLGNTALNNSYHVKIDNTAPTITLPIYVNGTQKQNIDTITLNISVSDTVSTLDQCNIEINGTNQTISVSNGWCNTTNGNLTGLSDGNKTIKVYANDSLGNLALNNSYVVDIITSNAAPTIGYVEAISAQDPSIGTTKSVIFNFTATDTNGGSDVNVSGAAAYFQKTGETTRYNTSCVNSSGPVGNDINVTCTVNMWYFDINGAWTINVTIKDNSELNAENSSTTFNYNLLTAMTMSPTSLTWAEINLQNTDVGSNNDPIVVNNSGNDVNLNINVTAYNLRGEITTTQYIYANNFTIENASQGCSGAAMTNATSINVTTAILQKGNNTLNYNNDTSGQEQIYFCLKGVPSGISAQSYSSAAYGDWIIRISLALLIPRKRKKKNVKDDKLVKALGLILEELKEEYSLNKKEMVDILTDKLKEKHRISKKEVIKTLDSKEEITLPGTIFSKNLGCLEAIVKYMKENLNMSYKEISDTIGRNERTIWTAYKKAAEKQKEPFEIKEGVNIPMEIFKNKNLTPLEALIVHLKNKKMKFVEIADLLSRDQRNIWTIYTRATKKVENNNV
ncbi:MAG: hypothetical protein AABW63_04135 [Nanoarchaeota archaeon]